MSVRKIAAAVFISIILAFIVLSNANAQSQAITIIENWVKASQATKFVEVSHDGISPDDNNITTINNLVIRITIDDGFFGRAVGKAAGDSNETPPGSLSYIITFPAVSFEELSLDDGYYFARSLKAETARLDFETSNTELTYFSAGGSYGKIQLNNIRWAKLPEIGDDAGKPVSKYFPMIEALLDLSFDSAKVDSMEMVQKIGDPAFTTTTRYGRMEMGKTVRGNFSSVLVAGMSVEMGPEANSNDAVVPAGSRISFRLGEMRAADYNYRGFFNNFSPGRISTGSDDPYETFLGRMSIDDIRVKAGGVEFSLDNFALNDVGVRPVNVDLLNEIDQYYLRYGSGKSISANPANDESGPQKLVELVSGFYGALKMGGLELQGMEFSSPTVRRGKIDRYRMSELSANGLGEMVLNGLYVLGKLDEYINIDQFSVTGLTFPSLKSLMNLAKAGDSGDVPAIMEAIPTLAGIAAKGIEARIIGLGDYSLAEYSTAMAKFIGPIPTDIKIIARDMKIPINLLKGEPWEIFSDIGYGNIEASFDFTAKWTEETSILSVQSRAELKDGDSLDVDIAIGGIPRNVFENPQTAQSAMAFVSVDRAKVELVDGSVVDKVLAFASADQGVSTNALKAQTIDTLPIAMQILQRPKFVDEVTAALRTFLDNGGKIIVNATPPAPVLILQLMGAAATVPGAVIDLLNVRVEAQ